VFCICFEAKRPSEDVFGGLGQGKGSDKKSTTSIGANMLGVVQHGGPPPMTIGWTPQNYLYKPPRNDRK